MVFVYNDRKLEVTINGKTIKVENPNTDPKAGIATTTIPVQLNKGNNVIRMCSPYYWTPDIDCFRLKKK